MKIKAGMLLAVLAGMAAFSASPGNAASVDFGLKSSAAFPGKDVTFAYRTRQVGKRQVVSLQRTFGSAAKYRTVSRLGITKGRFRSVKIKAPTSMGRYRYRVVVKNRRGRLKARSKQRVLTIYDAVPLERLVGRGSSYTVQIGSTLFRYVWAQSDLNNGASRILKMDQTSCRALILEVAVKDQYGDSNAWLSVVQETGDPQTVNFTSNAVKAITLSLTGDAFVLSIGSSSRNDPNGFLNGTGLCFTPNGRLSSQH